jgi:hypothetical protein
MWGGGNYGGLVPLLLLPLVAGVGMVFNLVIFLRLVVTGRPALGYFLGFVLLLLVCFCLLELVSHNLPGKIGG